MESRIMKRFMSIIVVLCMLFSYLPFAGETIYAASVDGFSVNGLEVSYTNGTWVTAGSDGLNGSATGTAAAGCSGASSTTSTLTLTNRKETNAQLSFNYSKPVLASGGSVKIDGTAVTEAGSFSKLLGNGGSVTITILSGSEGAFTSSVSLTNIMIIEEATVTTTFRNPQGNGSYTVNGTAITDVYMSTRKSTDAYTLSASPADGYKLEGWYDETNDRFFSDRKDLTTYFSSDSTVYPVFIPVNTPVWEVGTKWLTDLNQAISYGQNHSIKKITLIGNGTLSSGTYTIPGGYTLLIPYDSAYTVSTTSPEIFKSSGVSAPSIFKSLRMSSGASLIVNGNICIGGKVNSFNNGYTGVTSGPFGYLIMDAGSTMTLNSGSGLFCWGYISGDGTITARSGSRVYEPFQICDIRGGTATSSMNNNSQKVLPFTQYYIQNIESELTIEYGAVDYAVGSVTIQNSTETPAVSFVGNSGSMFTLSSGASFTRKYDPAEDRVSYEITGDAGLNSITMEVYVTIRTANYVLPIMQGTTIRIHSGTTTINQDICMIPGSEVIVDQGAVAAFSSGKNVYLYDRDEWAGGQFVFSVLDYPTYTADMIPSYYSPSRVNANKFDPSKMTDAKADVNGSIEISGKMYTTASGADITSSQGTGTVHFISKPTANATTYQAVQTGSDIAYTSIAVTSAKLHNGNPSVPYTLTDNAAAGDTYSYDLSKQMWGTWKTYTVTFMDGDTVFRQLSVTEGNTVPQFDDPVKEGYLFTGWYDGDTKFEFDSTVIDSDRTYNARWHQHSYGTPVYTWADDLSSVTASVSCTEGDDTIEETVSTRYVVTVDPSCETEGTGMYEASFQNELFEDQQQTITLPALGHDWDDTEYTWNGQESVTAGRVCKKDPSHMESETVPTTYEVTTSPTCTGQGEGTYTAVFTNPAFEPQTKTTELAALGHDWAEITYTWEEDLSGVTALKACRRDHDHDISEMVDTVSEITKEATCEENGETTYTAVFTNDAFETQIRIVNDIEATGHDWGTPSYTWAEDLSFVTAERTCTRNSSHTQSETVSATSEVTRPASCEETGEETFTSSSFQNEAFSVQTIVVEVPATGHDWSAPNYLWSEDNASVKAFRVCTYDASHREEETVNTSSEITRIPSCETKGQTTYTAAFTNDAFGMQIRTVDNIEALGHLWEEPEYTWFEDNKTVTASRICQRDASHKETETVNTIAESTDASCETPGTVTYTAVFANEAFETQTKTVTGQALGHDWEVPTYTWASDNSSVTAERFCKRDPSHKESEKANVTSAVTRSASCTENGETTYTSGAFSNEAFSIQTKTLKDIPATGHNWGAPSYEWALDNSSVTAKRTCSNDPSHFEKETVNTALEIALAPSCEAKGKTTYTASFTNTAFTVQTKTVEDIPALGHDPLPPVEENRVESDCTTEGHYDMVTYCNRCGEELNRDTITIPALGHDYVSVVTSPTCTERGYTTHTCSRCDDSYIDTYVDALGHAYGEWEVTTPPTCTQEGEETRVCAHDLSHTETRPVDALGHNYESVTTPPTCTERGYTTHSCTRCDDTYIDTYVDALGHDWNEPVWSWSDDYSFAIASFICKRDPSHKEERNAVITVSETEEAITYTATVVFDETEYTDTAVIEKELPPVPVTGEIIRLSGKLRYDTSLKVAEELKEVLKMQQFDTVILATGENFADALGGGYLAARKNAPILLTKPSQASKVNGYINANLKAGGTIYVLGGTGAVPEECLAGLDPTFNVDRLSGKTRYDTNLLILDRAGVSAEDLLICSGESYADALAASAAGRPLLLVNTKKNVLTDAQREFLAAHSSGTHYIIGGSATVSDVLEEELTAYGVVTRIKGSTRYETSVVIGETFFSNAEKAVLAYSDDYPDGLCAGPLAHALNAPILLTKEGKESAAGTYCSAHSIHSGYIVGGDARIPDASARDIFSVSEDTPVTKK